MATSRTCPVCQRGSVTELEMAVKNGQRLRMSSCTKCEARTWTADGVPVTRDEVLKITADDPDFVVVPTSPKTRRSRVG